MTHSPQTEDLVAEAVVRYRDCTAAGDTRGADHARAVVAELCHDHVRSAACSTFRPSFDEYDDVVATAQMVFFEVLPAHLEKFDPSKGTAGRPGSFASWVTHGCRTWSERVRRELRASAGANGRNVADENMQRIYFGCRTQFESLHGRTWTAAEAREAVYTYLVDTTAARLSTKHPDLESSELRDAAIARVTRDGHMRTLRELDDVIRGQETPLSLDQPAHGDATSSLGDLLADTTEWSEPASQDTDLPTWAQVATLGMDGRVARGVVRFFEEPDERTLDAKTLACAQQNLADPLRQFVVLADIESQFEADVVGRSSVSDLVRAQLVSAASSW